ncbi:MAG: hypothetical protein QMD92_08440 [bacterium]|nr:hypothetical protein [bacterium]
MKNGQDSSSLNEHLSSILEEEINNLKQIYNITLKIEKTIKEKEIDKLENLIQKRGNCIQTVIELRNQELSLKKQNIKNLNTSYFDQARDDLLHQIKNTEIKAENTLKHQIKETRIKLNKIFKYQELRKTYIKEGGEFFDEAFFVDKKS